MEDNRDRNDDPCACQAFVDSASGEADPCAAKKNVFTRDELQILSRIREVQQAAQDLKGQIRDLERSSPRDHDALSKARKLLQDLRQERTVLEEQRVVAAGDRMRLLGHE
jgi:hypothetical protein